MAAFEIILLEGFGDPGGNRLLDRLEEHTGLVGDPLPGEPSRRYEIPAETREKAESVISDIFENQLIPPEPRWRDSLTLGTEGWS
jgi:hypothetical protein